MLQVLVGYILGVGVGVRWLVIAGDPEFFAVTKRIHNRLHGVPGDQGSLGDEENAAYESVQAANAEAIAAQVRPGDVVLLHDPQTAGLAAPLKATGAAVLWRCHVGSDAVNQWTDDAWEFLRPHLTGCDGFVFTRRAYVPAWIPMDRVSIIPPSIDPFSPKNQDLSAGDGTRILAAMGVLDGTPTGVPAFTRRDGSAGYVSRRATVCGRRTSRRGCAARRPGIALGPPQGHGRGHGGLRGRVDRSSTMPSSPWWVHPSTRSVTTLKAARCSSSASRRGAVFLPSSGGRSDSWCSPWMIGTRTRRWSTRCSVTPPSSCRRAWLKASA